MGVVPQYICMPRAKSTRVSKSKILASTSPPSNAAGKIEVPPQSNKVGTIDAPHEEAPTVTQVVEVVEEVPSEVVAEAERPVEKEVTSEVKEEPVDDEDEMVTEAAHEKNREVVEEIFAKGNSRIGEEMVMDVKENVASIYWWAIAVISCVVTIGGILIFVNAKDKFNFTLPTFLTSTPTPMSQPTATPTPLPPDRSKVKVQVLNGAGVAGAAGKMKSLLEEKGYVVMGTGNADNYDYEETVIQVKEEVKNIVDLLKTDLGEIYKVASEVASLASSEKVDIVVIVGKE